MIAECFEAVDEAALGGSRVTLVKVGWPEVEVGTIMIGQQVIDDYQNAMADRHGGFLPPAAGGQPPILSGEIRLFVARCSVCRLDQRGAQPGTALTRLAAALASSLRAPSRPHPHPHPCVRAGPLRFGRASALAR